MNNNTDKNLQEIYSNNEDVFIVKKGFSFQFFIISSLGYLFLVPLLKKDYVNFLITFAVFLFLIISTYFLYSYSLDLYNVFFIYENGKLMENHNVNINSIDINKYYKSMGLFALSLLTYTIFLFFYSFNYNKIFKNILIKKGYKIIKI